MAFTLYMISVMAGIFGFAIPLLTYLDAKEFTSIRVAWTLILWAICFTFLALAEYASSTPGACG